MIHLLVTADGCPTRAADSGTDPVTRLGCTVSGAGDWLTLVPGRLAHWAAVSWPWLLASALVVLVATLAVRAVYRRAWRRAVRRGYWVQLTPPRVLDPLQSGNVWRLLAGLARRARAGQRLARPPLAFEVYASGGHLIAGLWLPRWVPLAVVLDEVARAWPGVRAQRRTPPVVAASEQWRVAGYRLAATGSDLVPLTDDPRPAGRRVGGTADSDPLRPVLAALGRPDGPAVLQVLARPATGKRLAALGHAARYGPTVRKTAGRRLADGFAAVVLGAARLLLDLITELISSGPARSTRSNGGAQRQRPADPLTTRAMRDAADKLADGPHLLATVRVGAARPDTGFAVTAARSLADGFVTASRRLRPVRLRRAAIRLADRWAGRGDWLLCTSAELGVLAHLPADPARYGFDTAALTRTPPTSARRAGPEHSSARGPGWTRHGWTDPPNSDPDDRSEGWEESA
ncbi:hypothetical protein [Paractinoplanes rishiriensis]|uniref:Type VI secretion protein n=1 Tax=Paractinoplanes rishiriensis TaxID=1050105 RepID=A0A919KA77_9ACTN|nr:hypothetical protein [Actinoplanes rishiriensis]GIE99491.1 hypothetical protein Ari01nite_69560 [Actinoplanes rishiriensis]